MQDQPSCNRSSTRNGPIDAVPCAVHEVLPTQRQEHTRKTDPHGGKTPSFPPRIRSQGYDARNTTTGTRQQEHTRKTDPMERNFQGFSPSTRSRGHDASAVLDGGKRVACITRKHILSERTQVPGIAEDPCRKGLVTPGGSASSITCHRHLSPSAGVSTGSRHAQTTVERREVASLSRATESADRRSWRQRVSEDRAESLQIGDERIKPAGATTAKRSPNRLAITYS